jgi:hypothetical protein
LEDGQLKKGAGAGALMGGAMAGMAMMGTGGGFMCA